MHTYKKFLIEQSSYIFRPILFLSLITQWNSIHKLQFCSVFLFFSLGMILHLNPSLCMILQHKSFYNWLPNLWLHSFGFIIIWSSRIFRFCYLLHEHVPGVFTNSGRVGHRVAMSVCLSVCAIKSQGTALWMWTTAHSEYCRCSNSCSAAV